LDTLAQDPLLKYILVEYTKYTEIFRERPKESTLLKYQAWDYKIKLKEDIKLLYLKIILLSEEKFKLLCEYLDENITKGFIRESSSIVGILIFFILKKGNEKNRPIIDYCGLNKIIIKDTYPLSLASKLRDQIQEAKYFTKLDQYLGFNLIRIKEEDK
jgi:hypothetical protein